MDIYNKINITFYFYNDFDKTITLVDHAWRCSMFQVLRNKVLTGIANSCLLQFNANKQRFIFIKALV